jgi:hypothetical protein
VNTRYTDPPSSSDLSREPGARVQSEHVSDEQDEATTLGGPDAAANVIEENGGDAAEPSGTARADSSTVEVPAPPVALEEQHRVTSAAACVAPERWLTGTSSKERRLIHARLRHALILQVVVVLVVLGYWAWGKTSWNHDPLTSQRFRPAELNVLANRAQNAALEFHHDLVTGQFGQARLLATESGEGLVDEASSSCAPTTPCGSGERVFTRATLLRTGGQEAEVLVESFTKDGKLLRDATYQMTRTTGQWLVERRTAP